MANGKMPELRLPLLMFGNGLQGRALRIKGGLTSRDGEKLTEIEFQPTRELMFHYDMEEKDFNVPERMSFIKRYPTAYVESLTDDPSSRAVLVLCDFKGGDTILTGKWATLIENNRSLQRTVNSLRVINAVLQYNYKKALANRGGFTKDMVEEMSQVMKLRGWDIMGMPPGGME